MAPFGELCTFLQIMPLKRNEIVTFRKSGIDKNISSLYNKNIPIGQLIHCDRPPDRNMPDEKYCEQRKGYPKLHKEKEVVIEKKQSDIMVRQKG